MKYLILIAVILTASISITSCSFSDVQVQTRSDHVIIVQPIVIQSDDGTAPASMAIPEDLVDKAYEKAGIDFYFLQPIPYNNTAARDGLINLDQIVIEANNDGIMRGQGEIVNMFFVNSVDGENGPLGRGMLDGNITFIALGDASSDPDLKYMQAFVIAHEVGHNLGLIHAVDDPNVPNDIPNIQGDGAFKDRIDPKYSLNEYQIAEIMKSPLVRPRIDILSLEESQASILDESFEPYFSKLQKREIETFIAEKIESTNIEEVRAYGRQRFQDAVLPFSPEEAAALKSITSEVNDILLMNGITLMANHPWRFIKITSWLCGGFAHTRGSFIILSQSHMDYLVEHWKDDMTNEEKRAVLNRMGGLLVHEQMHSLQRSFPEKFKRLNTEFFNFVNGTVEKELEITLNQVSNPDAPNAEWLIPHQTDANKFYWIRTLLDKDVELPQMGRDFQDTVFTVVRKNGKYEVEKDETNNLVSFGIDDFKFFVDTFPVTRGIDHPNEIAAYMFSDYFIALLSEDKTAFENVSATAQTNSAQFVEWVNAEMKSN